MSSYLLVSPALLGFEI